MKPLAALVALLALGAVVATSALAAPPQHASVTIRHQMMGCHAWSVGTGPYSAHAATKLSVGGSITFTDNDVMSHQLIKKSGSAVVFSGSHTMGHMGATLKVTFPHAGTYIVQLQARNCRDAALQRTLQRTVPVTVVQVLAPKILTFAAQNCPLGFCIFPPAVPIAFA
jgi:plastocyanin